MSRQTICTGTMYRLGESERQLREMFERARELEPAIVLIDEVDVLGPHRDSAHRYEVSLLPQLLVLVDGLEDRGLCPGAGDGPVHCPVP